MKFSELSLLERLFKHYADGVLIDVGAHHGGFSSVFAKKGWQVIAFEPEEKNRLSLQKNIHGYNKCIILAKAVCDIDNIKIPFYVSNKHYGIHSIKPFHETHEFAYEVDTTTLNTALEQANINNVTFLKIDIEGADFLAIKGFNIEKYSPDVIMLEFMDERSIKYFSYNHHDVVRFMNGKGYVCYLSEWAPIKQYGIEGVASEPHTWLQCKRYPLDHDPTWGNLIFIKNEQENNFINTLTEYLKDLSSSIIHQSKWRSLIKKIPGTRFLYHRLFSSFKWLNSKDS